MTRFFLATVFGLILSGAARAETIVFNCELPGMSSFFVTVYDDRSARVGIGQGVGDKGQAYFDALTGAWVVVEFIANGALPSSLTTILKDGTAWHSRHTLDVLGKIMPMHISGKCLRASIR